MQGQQPETKSEIDSIWDKVMTAGRRSDVL
jgi:hypothetical protein